MGRGWPGQGRRQGVGVAPPKRAGSLAATAGDSGSASPRRGLGVGVGGTGPPSEVPSPRGERRACPWARTKGDTLQRDGSGVTRRRSCPAWGRQPRAPGPPPPGSRSLPLGQTLGGPLSLRGGVIAGPPAIITPTGAAEAKQQISASQATGHGRPEPSKRGPVLPLGLGEPPSVGHPGAPGDTRWQVPKDLVAGCAHGRPQGP